MADGARFPVKLSPHPPWAVFSPRHMSSEKTDRNFFAACGRRTLRGVSCGVQNPAGCEAIPAGWEIMWGESLRRTKRRSRMFRDRLFFLYSSGRGKPRSITRPRHTRLRPLLSGSTTSASARLRFREKRYTVPPRL